jgi:ketosteroid isomerase-like protein
MRYLYLITLGSLLMLSCRSQQQAQDETPAVERVVYDLFISISTFNYASIRDHCTDDFVMFADGRSMNLDEFIRTVQAFEDEATISYELTDIKTNISGTLAWMTLKNQAVMIRDEQPEDLAWLESAVVVKNPDGLWRLAFYHSTPVKLSKAQD